MGGNHFCPRGLSCSKHQDHPWGRGAHPPCSSVPPHVLSQDLAAAPSDPQAAPWQSWMGGAEQLGWGNTGKGAWGGSSAGTLSLKPGPLPPAHPDSQRDPKSRPFEQLLGKGEAARQGDGAPTACSPPAPSSQLVHQQGSLPGHMLYVLLQLPLEEPGLAGLLGEGGGGGGGRGEGEGGPSSSLLQPQPWDVEKGAGLAGLNQSILAVVHVGCPRCAPRASPTGCIS